MALDRGHVVGDEDDRAPLGVQPGEGVEALALEGGVADREHLVDQQDLGVDVGHQREPQPHQHPRRVVLELHLGELLELGELDHLVEARPGVAWGEAHHHAVEHHVLVRGELRVEADAELDAGRDAAARS